MSPSPAFHPHLALSASAGSGKTFALAARYVALLFMGESPASILAATFTRKAAAEMRQRVIDSLKGIGDANWRENKKNISFIDAVCTQTGLDQAKLIARQPRVLAQFLSTGSYIVTLDSFFAGILRSSSLEIGIDPNFVTKEIDQKSIENSLLDELSSVGMLQALAKTAIEMDNKRFHNIMDILHDLYTVDPLLPDLEPCTKKLRDIERDIDDLRGRLHDTLIESGASKSAVNNFAPADVKTLSTKSIIKYDTLREHRFYRKYLTSHPQIENMFQELKELLKEWMKVREAYVIKKLLELYGHYRNTNISRAKTAGVLSFDDLGFLTYQLLHESISREFLYFKIDTRFHHILLDEFQDTSTLQFLLLKPLIDEIFAGEGQNGLRSFFYVGDTKQSLYRFRGGVEELFDKIADNYDSILVENMDTSYRSARTIIKQINKWFIDHMPGYTPQKSNGIYDQNGNEISGYVDVLQIPEESEEPAWAMMEMMTERIADLHGMGVDWDDIAILVHTNKEGQNIRDHLRSQNIPAILKTSSSLRYLPRIAALAAMVEYIYRREAIDAEAMLEMISEDLSSIDLREYNIFMSPLQILDKLIRDMGYFDNDPNILKLLEFASGFDDIATFLDEFKTSQTETAAHTVHGIQIMTIHGSKGLEFDHVIVMDRFSRPRSDTSVLLFDYADDLSIRQILLRTKHREFVDPNYAKLLKKISGSAHKDHLNLLYVALTRAAEGLTIVRKPKESVFDTIGIEPMKLGKTARGTKDKSLPATHYPLPTQHTVLRNYGYQEKPTPDEDKDTHDQAAIIFGTALHFALEMMADFTPRSIPDAINAMRSRYGTLLSEAQTDDIARRIKMLMVHPEFLSLISSADIISEQPIAYQGELRQIDLLLEYPKYNLVIDYKSSMKYSDKHRAQISHYAHAIKDITGKPTDGMIIYLLSDKIEIRKL